MKKKFTKYPIIAGHTNMYYKHPDPRTMSWEEIQMELGQELNIWILGHAVAPVNQELGIRTQLDSFKKRVKFQDRRGKPLDGITIIPLSVFEDDLIDLALKSDTREEFQDWYRAYISGMIRRW